MISTLLLPTLLTLAAAQSTTTLTFFGPGADNDYDTYNASVVAANSAATTFAFEQDSELLQTFVHGPSTWNLAYSDYRPDDDFAFTMDCSMAPSSAVCKESATGSEANFPGSSTTTYDEVGTWTIRVTAGAEKLTQSGEASAKPSATSSAAEKSAAASAGSSVQTPSVTPAPGSGSAAASVSVSRTGSVAAPASTGGAAVNAMVFGGGLAGVAAGVFGGLLL